MDYKALPQFTKSIENRTVSGVFCVHGNIDDGGDRSFPGAFASFAVEGRPRAKLLWQHNSNDPPIGTLDGFEEVGRADLPPKVLSYAPNATGGVIVTRTYLDTPRGNEVLAGIKAGAITEMSYAYEATKTSFEELDGKTIRNLHAMEIFDVSDVNWGMNPATVASKGRPPAGMPFQVQAATVLAAVEDFIDRARDFSDLRRKEGRTLSSANVSRLQSLYDALVSVSSDLKTLLAETAPKSDPAVIRALLIESQRLQAHLNGASIT